MRLRIIPNGLRKRRLVGFTRSPYMDLIVRSAGIPFCPETVTKQTTIVCDPSHRKFWLRQAVGGKGTMQNHNLGRWMERFPFVDALTADERDRIARVVQFPVLSAGDVAYEQDSPCHNYLMCIEGRTRIFKTSAAGREMLLYKVIEGGTCVLTTQCLLSRSNFPAESIAESRTELAAVPASWFYTFMAEIPAFRDFVMADYTKLLTTMFSFVDTLAFATVEQRLARRLLAEAGETLVVGKTHQQLASEVGSVREIISRHLGEWERSGWVRTGRGQIEILDRTSLASRQAH